MASKGYTESILNTLPADQRKALNLAFNHTLDTFRIGGNPKALNFAWYVYSSTTSSTAGTEFSIEHGQGMVPTKMIPMVDLSQVGSQLVPLTVSKAPDDRRIYLTSTSTSAVFTALVEF